MAKRIKSISPEIFVVFGGPNCEGLMGIEVIRQFPFVDAVVSGEGDIVFPEIVGQVLRHQSLSGIQGVLTKDVDLESEAARRGGRDRTMP